LSDTGVKDGDFSEGQNHFGTKQYSVHFIQSLKDFPGAISDLEAIKWHRAKATENNFAFLESSSSQGPAFRRKETPWCINLSPIHLGTPIHSLRSRTANGSQLLED
jgi:hypothetical protein